MERTETSIYSLIIEERVDWICSKIVSLILSIQIVFPHKYSLDTKSDSNSGTPTVDKTFYTKQEISSVPLHRLHEYNDFLVEYNYPCLHLLFLGQTWQFLPLPIEYSHKRQYSGYINRCFLRNNICLCLLFNLLSEDLFRKLYIV